MGVLSTQVFQFSYHGFVSFCVNNYLHLGIDTDKYKYPIGSGRVTFDNQRSYLKAVAAAFIEIRTAKFTKKVGIIKKTFWLQLVITDDYFLVFFFVSGTSESLLGRLSLFHMLFTTGPILLPGGNLFSLLLSRLLAMATCSGASQS